MKREIKYRGWNKKNKKWLYGYLFPNRGEFYIIEDGLQPWDAAPEDFLVEEETIEQYTGLCDEDGNDIYEGDVMVFVRYISHNGDIAEKEVRGVVSFEDGYFVVKGNDRVAMLSVALNEPTALVLGNIYDNPYLLNDTTYEEN